MRRWASCASSDENAGGASASRPRPSGSKARASPRCGWAFASEPTFGNCVLCMKTDRRRTDCGTAQPTLGVDRGNDVMKTNTNWSAPAWSCCLIALFLLHGGCSGSSPKQARFSPPQATQQVLSQSEAAELAARLANDECERLYQKRPFVPDQSTAVLEGAEYRWGGLDVRGRGGFSTLVTFKADGSHPKVEVYFSTDTIFPQLTPLVPKPFPRRTR